MAIVGELRKIHRSFLFLVEIDGIGSAKFQQAGAPEAEAEEIIYREGGDAVGIKVPGLINVSDVVLVRGVADDDLYDWWTQVYDFVAEGGVQDSELLRNAELVQLDRDRTELHRWALFATWPKKFKGGEWNNDNSETVVEEITLSIRGFQKIA